MKNALNLILIAVFLLAFCAAFLPSFDRKERDAKVKDNRFEIVAKLSDARIQANDLPNGEKLIHEHQQKHSGPTNVSSFESGLVSGNELNISYVREMYKYGDAFRLLEKEFRNLSDIKAIAASAYYRDFFLSRESVLKGIVVVEALECGTSICIVEFRANNKNELRIFLDDAFLNSYFNGVAIVKLGFRSEVITDSYFRYLFLHDQEVRRTVFSDGTAFTNTSPSGDKSFTDK